MRTDIAIADLKSAIDALLVQFPEIAEDEILRADVFEGQTEILDIVYKLLDLALNAKTMGEAIGLRVEELRVRGSRYDRREQAMRSLIQSIMERGDLKKLTLPDATLSVSYRKPAPFITDENSLPAECVKMVKKPDMATIKAWCESGNIPDGVAMSNGKSVLTIRTK